MGVKRPRALALYQALPGVLPSASLDARILAAARVQPRARSMTPLALAAAAVLVIVFTLRLVNPGSPTRTAATRTDFGIAEGQARAVLTTIHPVIASGPGSQEGKP